MQRRKFTDLAVVTLALMTTATGAFAQQAPANGGAAPQAQPAQQTVRRGRVVNVRGNEISLAGVGTPPALMFKETWKMPPYTAPLNDEKRRVSHAVVTNPQLELKLYGPNSRDLLTYEHEGLVDLWTGISAPLVIMLRDKNNFVELPRLSKMRVTARTNGLHKLHPTLKLADGTFLIGDRGIDTEGDFKQTEILFNDVRWFRLDPEKLLVMREVLLADLSRVDEIGVSDLMAAGGHNGAGWVNLSTVELYANPVPR